ncbi:uncharacterized protein L969DRAFT_90767 [Mixia osmundae IAM 14324]|uniref:Peptidase M20 dimerisation domain-containing protein n=1 Tax=Mixia osmundae (strain CBS 9802 / IAM 14324 / JCM 22182 / KY 12970) TaxID=764103 RepID=G7DW43_MIXOS|nr:uncharacterized protein L969DRAFT_90767 [Mixia osmundae IAM 14324]KEI36453.1 hypothetical protein L969DRAFT_90767 [Mixia osmundae IAM 14324]GAA94849.1 hypothetical protein E5Q_01503 [Mixia osmundae IAM 14324]
MDAPWLKWITDHETELVGKLAEAVAIPSISGDAKFRPEVHRMMKWVADELESLSASVEMRPLGEHTMNGAKLELPPIVLATVGTDPRKKTILLYAHADVQPASSKDSGWSGEDPFELRHDKATGRLYGRGSTDDKGPLVGWLNVLKAHAETKTELPVNLKFCIEGMEESGSEGLDELVEKEAKKYFAGTDAVCISDNYWLNTTKPALTYGLRGIAYFFLHINGPGSDLHSGLFGAMASEPMVDVVALMSKLVDSSGKILVPGLLDQVAKLTPEERKRYEDLDFSANDIYDAIGSKTTLSDDKVTLLMARMRNPSLSLHGIEGAFAEPGSKTVIPCKVTGKFSIRLVPDMQPEKVVSLVRDHLETEFAKLNSKNTMSVECGHAAKAWVADPTDANFTAAAKAIKTVWGVDPQLTREGGSIPVTLTFADNVAPTMLLPMGRSDDGAHSAPEKLDISNYIKGTQVLGLYLHEAAKLL